MVQASQNVITLPGDQIGDMSQEGIFGGGEAVAQSVVWLKVQLEILCDTLCVTRGIPFVNGPEVQAVIRRDEQGRFLDVGKVASTYPSLSASVM